MKPMNKRVKIDIGLVAQALNNSNKTGKYFGMQLFQKIIFILIGGAMAAEKTTKLEILQAKDSAGTGAKAVSDAATTITANTKVTGATLTLASVLNTQAVTINGLVFTGHTDTTDKTKRQFSIATSDTAAAAELVKCINDEANGVQGVTAISALGVVTLATTDGATTITITDPAATITTATTEAQAFVEVDVGSLDLAGGFEFVAAKVTTTANSVIAVEAVRGDGRFEPVQSVGAHANI